MRPEELARHIQLNVTAALNEDLGIAPDTSKSSNSKMGPGADLTAQLVPENLITTASIISRQKAYLCGTQWLDYCFQRLDQNCIINWSAKDGDFIKPNQVLCNIRGNARAMLTAERTALNFLQTLSGTTTLVRSYVNAVTGINVKIMDTRKTLPGLRAAQKYAVRIGGGLNQRSGLFDGILIKENHIKTAGGISKVMALAKRIAPSDLPIQIEVETLAQLKEALDANAKLILLDNFSMMNLRRAVSLTGKRAVLESSGNINLDKVCLVAETGVDRISIGSLTKDVLAVDLSMRFE